MKKIRHILNNGPLLNYALCIMNCALIVGCSSDESLSNASLSEEGRTPLVIEASLSTGSALTRAEGKAFDEGDQLLAYLRHTTGTTKGSYTLVTTDKSPLLVTFTKGSKAMVYVDANTNRTSDDLTPHTPLYWEDFSNSASDDTDLRSDGHGLQSYYGYCYNGGTPSTALDEATGVLGWTVKTDQSTAANFKNSDLLWSSEQETTLYHKGPMPFTATQALSIPYTHAMSEITVKVTAGEGFTGNPLGETVLNLYGMNTFASLEAPKDKVVTSGTPATITMCGDTYSTGLIRNYSAIVAPGTILKVDEDADFLIITDVDGNNYKVKITSTMVPKDNDEDDSNNEAWSKNHKVMEDNNGKKYIETKPGYNYELKITLKKTAIEVEAQITDWTPVTATGTGEIQFPTVDFSMTGLENFTNGASIYLFQLLANTESDTKEKRINSKYGSSVTTSTYNATSGKWTNSPLIYWPNQTNNYYFRALSQSSDAVAQGTDVLWGTTPAHDSYDKGAAIAPRKNEVPLAFEHAMSKVTFQLETASGMVGPNSPVVDLTGATIAISNLSTSGTIAIEDGAITPATTAPITELIVIPQTIGDDAIVTITLADGTTYKLQLNSCLVKSSTDDNHVVDAPITQWRRGDTYSYTIHLEKEQITFRALIKDWEDVTGSGNANLEWD